ncbi:MAG: hypothetical protein ACRCT8_08700 [Lacipirellulaceae bacterium]
MRTAPLRSVHHLLLALVLSAVPSLGAEPTPLRSTDVDAAVAAWASRSLTNKPGAAPTDRAAAARAAFAQQAGPQAVREPQPSPRPAAAHGNPLRAAGDAPSGSLDARRAFEPPNPLADDRYASAPISTRLDAQRLDRAATARTQRVVTTAAGDPFAAPPLAPAANEPSAPIEAPPGDSRYSQPAKPAANPFASDQPSTDRYGVAGASAPQPFFEPAPAKVAATPPTPAPTTISVTPSEPKPQPAPLPFEPAVQPSYRTASAAPLDAPAAKPPAAFAVDSPAPAPFNEPARPMPLAPPSQPVEFRPNPAPIAAASPPIASPAAPLSGATVGEGTGRPGNPALEGPQQATLVVHKRGPSEARVGQPCRFVLSVRNTGSAPAEGVVLRDETPAGARLDGAQPAASSEGSQLVWQLGALAPGEEKSVELRVTPLREGPIGSVASASFATRAAATTRVTRPQLAVRLSAPPQVARGEDQTVRIEVSNPGSGTATGVMLVENVPDNLRHEAGSELEFEIGTLEAGKSRTLELVLHAERGGHTVNSLTVTADGGLQAAGRVEFDVVAPELAVAVEGPRRRYLERPASYTVSIGNPGTATATNVRLVTHLPKGLEFVRANNMGEYDAQTHAVYWSLAELPQGQRGAVELVAVPKAAGKHTLRVEGEASNGLRVEEVQELTVEGVSSLAFEVRDLEDPIDVGGSTDYEVRVTNEGTKSAAGVVVRVESPAGMKPLSAEGQTAHRMLSNAVEFAPLAELAPGAEARYRVRLEGAQPGDQRVAVLVKSSDLEAPIRREESTRVYGDE